MSLLCAIPLAASLFASCGPAAPLAVGYVEGEYALLAPTETAQVLAVEVRRGQRVEPGDTLVMLEDADAEIAVAQAEAAVAQAEAQLADLKLGKRPEEIAVLEAALKAAKAEEQEARRVLARTEDLRQRGIATQAEYDRASTALERAEAQTGQAEANLAVGGLAARAQTISAAEARVKKARAALEAARWRLSERVIKAPSPGRVDDVIRNAGDVAGPSAPVVSMLPDGAVKLKLYAPQAQFSALEVGQTLAVRCDGCPAGLQAEVSYISPDPEFTPPVIYSLETRQKLVYLVEARPVDEATMLQPGQIVDVRLADEADGSAP